MEIIYKKGVESAKELYQLTRNDGRKALKELESGATIELDKVVIYDDVNTATGERVRYTAFATAGNVYVTNSAYFTGELLNMLTLFDNMGETITSATIIRGKSKKGRTFTTVIL